MLALSATLVSCERKYENPPLPKGTEKTLIIRAGGPPDPYNAKSDTNINVWLVHNVSATLAKKALKAQNTCPYGWDDQWHWIYVPRGPGQAELWTVSKDEISVRQMMIFLLDNRYSSDEGWLFRQPAWAAGMTEYLMQYNMRSYFWCPEARSMSEEELLFRLRKDELFGRPDTVFEIRGPDDLPEMISP